MIGAEARKVFTQNKIIAQTIALPHVGIVSRRETISLALANSWKSVLVLLFLVLISALGFVYMKDASRQLYTNYEQTQKEFLQLSAENDSLLLEDSAWANQGRVQQIAEKQFNMILPQMKSVVLLKM